MTLQGGSVRVAVSGLTLAVLCFLAFILNLVRLEVGASRAVKLGLRSSLALVANRLGCDRTVSVLLGAGAGANSANRDGYTLTAIAAAEGRIGLVRELVRHGADVNLATDQAKISGGAPLFVARDPEIVALLLQAGARPNGIDRRHAPIAAFAQDGAIEAATVLLQHGADPNGTDLGRSAIVWAAEKSDAEMVRLLVRSCAGIEVKDLFGRTAKDVASTPEIASILESESCSERPSGP